MRILLVNSVCGIGSTGKICVDIAKLLEEQGHDCVIAYGRGNAKGYDKTYKITSSLGNKIHYLKSRLFDKHGLGNVRETKKFIKFIKEYNPDIIHLHNIHGYYLNYKILFKYLQTSKAKVVWTMHDMWSITGHCAYVYECEKWINGCYQCSKLHDYPAAILDNSRKNYELKKGLFDSINDLTIVVVSQWIKNEFKKSFLKDKNIKIINNGLDLNIFKPRESEFRKKFQLEDKKIILGVADRWGDRKGFKDFLKLSEMLDENTRIVMVGLTQEQVDNLPSNIIGITRTDNQQQLAEIYSTSDLYINLTYSDNFPTVNLEALACGTPVLTYNTGGSPEMLTTETGFVVEQGDLNGVVDVIENFNKTEELKEKCLSQAQNYDKREKFGEYIKLYHECQGVKCE